MTLKVKRKKALRIWNVQVQTTAVVEPYMYEPAADSDSTEVELPDSDVERLHNTEW